jgi:(S)-2-hydroxyglutarate dehydrogenase
MNRHQADLVVVGGGIVGLAVARALAGVQGLRVLVLEKERRLAAHQSGHNSGVIHSGLYYRPGSLKAANCAAGREALYRYCEERRIPYERCGKLVVATGVDEVPALQELQRRGRANGLEGLQWLDGSELGRWEPEVAGVAGLQVPQTGIVDYVRVAEAFAGDLRSLGGALSLGCELRGVRRQERGFELETTTGRIGCRWLINCAGLHCDRVARLCGLRPEVRIIPFRGEYYTLARSRRHLVRHLIYPVPDPALPFLGVHLTRMVDGEVEAGPNAVLALKREGYRRSSFSLRDSWETLSYPGFWHLARRFWRVGAREYYRSFRKAVMVQDLRRLLPALQGADLQPGGSGVRAQAVAADGRLLDDFHFLEAESMIHVLNAPSPAATASLAIGATVANRARDLFALP